jgi:MoaA/NifB/PqqE/SkfB family radical SAM enzyme
MWLRKMDLQTSIFNTDNINEYQIEITTYCNASCPQCPRNINGGVNNPYLKLEHLSPLALDNTFTKDICESIDRIFFCGSYGDPIMHPKFLKILKDFRKKSPSLWLFFHTNGSVHDTKYWNEMANIIGGYGHVEFNIDGLSDTNNIYRKDTDFNKIINNAKAFIDAGGNAKWNFIVFKHNEHQVDDARKLANDIGFSEFNTKLTGRFLNHATLEEIDSWPIMDNNDNQVGKLEIPLSTQFKNKSIKNLPLLDTEYFNTTNILCDALHKNPANSRYNKHNEVKVTINAHGWVMPCNFFNHNLHDMRFHDRNALPCSNDLSFTENGTNQIKDLFNQYDAQNNLNINTKSLSEIFENGIWNHILESFNKNIGEGRLFECAMTCGDKLNKVWDQTRK